MVHMRKKKEKRKKTKDLKRGKGKKIPSHKTARKI